MQGLVLSHCLKGFYCYLGSISCLSNSVSVLSDPVSLCVMSEKKSGILPWGFFVRCTPACAHVLTLVMSWLHTCSIHLKFTRLRSFLCFSYHCLLIISSI